MEEKDSSANIRTPEISSLYYQSNSEQEIEMSNRG
jgi:hypothetical protein